MLFSNLNDLNRAINNGEVIFTDVPQEVITPTIKVKYHDPEMPHLERLLQGDWIDLVNVEDIKLAPGEFGMFSLGVSMELPNGYEAHVVPRSSTYKKWGVLQVNTPAIIDNSFKGDDDIWHWLIMSPKEEVFIPKYTRVCQFRVVESQPIFPIVEVDKLYNKSRGGWGSTDG